MPPFVSHEYVQRPWMEWFFYHAKNKHNGRSICQFIHKNDDECSTKMSTQKFQTDYFFFLKKPCVGVESINLNNPQCH